MVKACRSFNKHIPLEERKVDATSIFGSELWKVALCTEVSVLAEVSAVRHAPTTGRSNEFYPHIPLREQAAAAFGVMRSQIPGHNPAKQKIPRFAVEWLARYEAGYDVTHWYTAGNQASQG